MPKLQKYKSNELNHENLKNVAEPEKRSLIESAVKAVEGYVQLSVIALGLLQVSGLRFGSDINGNSSRFMRTVSNEVPSERTVADFMRKNIYLLFRFFPNMLLTLIIRNQQPSSFDYDFDNAA
jgi:preprotein translocase subunit SecG